MVVMKNTRATTLTMVDNTKKFNHSIIGIKGDPVTAEASDIKVVDDKKLGVTNVREAMDLLADMAKDMAIDMAEASTAAAANINTMEVNLEESKEALRKESIKNAILY